MGFSQGEVWERQFYDLILVGEDEGGEAHKGEFRHVDVSHAKLQLALKARNGP